jgi:hypothetical protein
MVKCVSKSCYLFKVKGKFHPRTGHEDIDRKVIYSCGLAITSVLDTRGWLMPRSGRFNSRNDPVPILLEALRATGTTWAGAEKLAVPGFEPRTVQPIAIRYTDYAILTKCYLLRLVNILNGP